MSGWVLSGGDFKRTENNLMHLKWGGVRIVTSIYAMKPRGLPVPLKGRWGTRRNTRAFKHHVDPEKTHLWCNQRENPVRYFTRVTRQ